MNRKSTYSSIKRQLQHMLRSKLMQSVTIGSAMAPPCPHKYPGQGCFQHSQSNNLPPFSAVGVWQWCHFVLLDFADQAMDVECIKGRALCCELVEDAAQRPARTKLAAEAPSKYTTMQLSRQVLSQHCVGICQLMQAGL